MRLLSLNDLADWPADGEPVALAYPYDSPHAARSGDPTVHSLSEAIDLYVLATRVLSSRFGEADLPSVQSQPTRMSDGMISKIVWDFDYYQLAIELQESGLRPKGYSVCMRSIPVDGGRKAEIKDG